MDVDGTNLTNLTDNPDTNVTGLVFSPDGEKIAFVGTTGPEESYNPDVYVMNADGTD
jgi:Tol biopolymer transport system component